jgi:hypothetical protein
MITQCLIQVNGDILLAGLRGSVAERVGERNPLLREEGVDATFKKMPRSLL